MHFLNNWYYNHLMALVHQSPTTMDVWNSRTQTHITRFRDAIALSLDLGPGIPCPRWRRLSPHIPLADTIWQLMGVIELTWLNQWAPQIWAPYVKGTVEPPRLFKAYGRRWYPQLDTAIAHLRHDSSSRQVYVATWSANVDLTSSPQTPMPPCILGFQLWLNSDNDLSMTVFSRSCDLVMGFPHDLMNFGILLHLFAHELGVPVGHLHLLFSDLHLYWNQRRLMKKMLAMAWRDPVTVSIPMNWTRHTVPMIENRNRFVEMMRDTYRETLATTPIYNLEVVR